LKEKTKDGNNKLLELLTNKTPTAIETQRTVRTSKGETKPSFRPDNPDDKEKNDDDKKNDGKNDDNKLLKLLEKALTTEKTTKERDSPFRPSIPHDLDETSDGLPPSFLYFLNLPYDSEGLARRFLARYGYLYRNVKNIGICKYNNGVYEKE
jgi:hypothetical protein